MSISFTYVCQKRYDTFLFFCARTRFDCKDSGNFPNVQENTKKIQEIFLLYEKEKKRLCFFLPNITNTSDTKSASLVL